MHCVTFDRDSLYDGMDTAQSTHTDNILLYSYQHSLSDEHSDIVGPGASDSPPVSVVDRGDCA